MELEKIPFDIKRLFKDITGLMFASATQKGLESYLQIDEEVPTILKGDPLRFRQVLLNLLSNALKFTEKGFIKVSLDKTDETSDEVTLEIRVEDTGIGIKKDKEQALFQKFTQADMTVSRKYGGTGLGLAIIKNIITLMGGKVTLNSEYGKGTEFVIKVPFDKAEDSEVENIMEKEKQTKRPVQVPVNLKILMAEDDRINQRVAKEIISKFGWKCTIANNGKEAVQMALNEDYDIIFMDIMMPEMDGITAGKEIKKSKDTPIIALSAGTLDEEVQKCLEAGMNGFVSKPINKNQLLRETLKHIPESKLEFHTKIDSGIIEKNNLGIDFVRNSIFPVFEDDINEKKAELLLAVENSDYKTIERVAHCIKSSSLYIGASNLSQIAKELEMAANKNHSIDQLQILMEKMLTETDEIMAYYQALNG